MEVRGRSSRGGGGWWGLLVIGLLAVASVLLSPAILLSQNNGGYSQQVELVYDDGMPDLSLTFLENAGTVFAVRFSPPAAGAQLVEVRYFTPDTSKGASFNLTVAKETEGEPGEPLLAPVPVKVKVTGWNALDLANHDLQVQGDFFVLLEYDGYAKLTLGAEDRPPLSGRTYDTDC